MHTRGAGHGRGAKFGRTLGMTLAGALGDSVIPYCSFIFIVDTEKNVR